MISSLTISQIHAQVQAIPERSRRNCVIGIRSSVPWIGESTVRAGGVTYFISHCTSPLAVREAIRQPAIDGIRVIITNVKDSDLDLDILLRLAKGQLFTIDRWSIVKWMFKATSTDPRISSQHWLADLLIEISQDIDLPPAVGGFLDAELVWPIILSRTLDMPASNLDLESILKWSTRVANIAKWKAMPEEFRRATFDWLSMHTGEAARYVMRTANLSDETDALPLGIVLDVLYRPEQFNELAIQRVRLEERYLGGDTLPDGVAKRWSAVSKNIIQLGMLEPSLEKAVLSRADSILKNIDAESSAYLSDVLPSGFTQRLERIGVCIQGQIAKNDFGLSDGMRSQVQQVKQHSRVRNEKQRILKLEMAIRVLRWLEAEINNPRRFLSFEDAADYQLTEGGFVDWARLSLHFAEPIAPLAEAYAKLFNLALLTREKQSERFAKLLVDWTKIGSTGKSIIGVEEITNQYLAPLALQSQQVKSRPVLMIVMDGMSVGVFRELIQDIVYRQEWIWAVRSDIGHLSGAVATIPSVTECSRASLFAGKISKGASDFESRAFAENQYLLGASKSGKPPRVFHKASLNPGQDSELANTVRETIADKAQAIIAVVVNAIDDHLAKGQQIEATWSRDGIKALSLLLHEAKNAGRAVLLVSDHGHVIDVKSRYENFQGGGERWRLDSGDPSNFECRILGTRVVGEDALIAPWSDSIRYTASKRNGYHGGINPQEMVVPIALLCPDDQVPDGWIEAINDEPQWWDITTITASSEPEAVFQLKPLMPKPVPPGMLFNVDEIDISTQSPLNSTLSSIVSGKYPEPSVGIDRTQWISRLLVSHVYEEQKRLGGRSVLTDEVVTRLLHAIDERGGKITSAALARAIQMPQLRLRGLLATAQRVFNVDGYEVLSRDDVSETIQLDRALLLKQFDLIE